MRIHSPGPFTCVPSVQGATYPFWVESAQADFGDGTPSRRGFNRRPG